MEKAREVDAAIRKNNVVSCVGFQGRYLDIIAQTKDLLKDRPVGMAMGILDGRDAASALVAAQRNVGRPGR